MDRHKHPMKSPEPNIPPEKCGCIVVCAFAANSARDEQMKPRTIEGYFFVKAPSPHMARADGFLGKPTASHLPKASSKDLHLARLLGERVTTLFY